MGKFRQFGRVAFLDLFDVVVVSLDEIRRREVGDIPSLESVPSRPFLLP